MADIVAWHGKTLNEHTRFVTQQRKEATASFR